MGCLKPFLGPGPDRAGVYSFFRSGRTAGNSCREERARSCTWSIAAKYRITSAARRAPITSANSSAEALRIREIVRNFCNSFSTDRAPSVGICSNSLLIKASDRFCRWNVMPKRCASSRMCISTLSASLLRSM